MTRASVTRTSIGVIVSRLRPIRARLGMAKAGIPSAGARYDSASHNAAKIRTETTAWRENFPSRPASRYSSGCIDDLVVRHVLVEAGFDRALHHVGDRLAHRTLPRRLHDHVQTATVDRGLENAGRQLGGIDGDLVGASVSFWRTSATSCSAASSILGA